ncbi:MAG: hypothetical protein JJE12_11375 [Anaerolineales bacterium]|nr:hypothetical protein [Anaerolineales bacterium]
MSWIANPEIWLANLTILGIVLGIDNLIFISILPGKLPESQQHRARQIWLSLALLTRISLFFPIARIVGLTEPLFAVFGQQISELELPNRLLIKIRKNSHETF